MKCKTGMKSFIFGRLMVIFMSIMVVCAFGLITKVKAETVGLKDINDCSVEFDESCYYNQIVEERVDRLRPIITVKNADGTILTENLDYTISAAPTGQYIGKYPLYYEYPTYFEDFTGNMDIVIIGKGEYSGEKKINRDFKGGVKISDYSFYADTFDDCLNLYLFFDDKHNGIKVESLNEKIATVPNTKENKKALKDKYCVMLDLEQKSSGKAVFKITCNAYKKRAKTVYYIFKDITPNTYISGRKSSSKGSVTLEFDCKSNKIFNYVNKKYANRDYYFTNKLDFDGFVVVGFKNKYPAGLEVDDNGMQYLPDRKNTFVRYVELPKNKLDKNSNSKTTKDVKITKTYSDKTVDISFKNLKDDTGSKVDLKLKGGRYFLTINDLPSGKYCVNVYTYKNIKKSQVENLNKDIVDFNRIYFDSKYDNDSCANYISSFDKYLKRAKGSTESNVSFDDQCYVDEVIRIK